MDSTLPHAFAAAAQDYAQRVALVEASGETTFADLKAQSDQLAQAWAAQGIKRGDRVVLAMAVGRDLYAALAALWTIGATVVLPEPAMGLKGLRVALDIGEIKGFCTAGHYRWLRVMPALWGVPVLRADVYRSDAPSPQIMAEPNDIALISFTSGSTGTPKAIPRSHAFLMAQQEAIAPLLNSDTPQTDLVAFPVFALINLAAGRTTVLPNWRMSKLDRVTPEALASWTSQTGCTRALLPPALCETLAEAQLPNLLHTLFTGGGPVFPDLVARLTDANPKLRMVCVYGSTEAEPIAHLDTADIRPVDYEAMQNGAGLLAGPPVHATQVRIENGEILVTGAHVNQSYLDPAQNAQTKRKIDGVIWHRTGDAGRMDDTGRLWLLGRHGAQIETASGTLYPFCIETAARLWPAVRRAALANVGGAILVVEGDATHLQSWEAAARKLGVARVVCAIIPLDRRHRSKVDYTALAKSLKP